MNKVVNVQQSFFCPSALTLVQLADALYRIPQD